MLGYIQSKYHLHAKPDNEKSEINEIFICCG